MQDGNEGGHEVLREAPQEQLIVEKRGSQVIQHIM